ncbi:Uncharacterized protein HSBGL_1172 [Halapricum desulfuricans]|uniref:Uncharacterized protein n=1 Tax=Halapricum desulfuricans TaxID=2841257 RepID=A0A897NN04_9EURY|nr:hypothetical protein [Halapricum desulfuricans]QSG11596.1 Uncharacterized protein HSBGL_1172 [Halapricum desulfuricans]
MTGPLRATAGWLARRSTLPTAVRAVFGYYGHTGRFDLASLRLKSTVDDRTEAMVEDVFTSVESALAREFGVESVSFEYDTKLLLPAELTLGYLYRRAQRRADGVDPVAESTWASRVDDAVGSEAYRAPTDPAEWDTDPDDPRELVDRAEYLTQVVIGALLDGDMRDAVNDAEYEDFEVSFDVDREERARVARVAQETLQADLEHRLEALPDELTEIYEWAVDLSEAHQDRDPHFRDLYERAREGDGDARTSIEAEYRDAPFDADTDVFTDEERDLPYLWTQYARVGVIYDAMIEMYRAAGLPVETAFKRSIVLSIVAAQIWLDDVDDYGADVADGQLTPVTAEYLLAEGDREAARRVRDLTEQYLDLARTYAAETESPLTGIATEYIYLSGDPDVLPGTD